MPIAKGLPIVRRIAWETTFIFSLNKLNSSLKSSLQLYYNLHGAPKMLFSSISCFLSHCHKKIETFPWEGEI